MKNKSMIRLFSKILIIFLFSLTISLSENSDYFLKTTGDRPYGIAFGKSGIMYMITAPVTGNGFLSQVTPDGKISRIAVIEGSFIGPGIFVDDNEDIFITTGDKLVKFNKDGKSNIISDGFVRSFDLKIDKNKNIFVADDKVCIIYKITPEGTKEIFYKSDSASAFKLTGIALDKKGDNLYAREGKKIIKFNLTSKTPSIPQIVINGIKLFYLSFDNNDQLYASSIDNIIKISPDSKIEKLFSAPVKSAVGFAPGGKGFKSDYLYISVEDGIIKVKGLK